MYLGMVSLFDNWTKDQEIVHGFVLGSFFLFSNILVANWQLLSKF